jgi:hypothetical protein
MPWWPGRRRRRVTSVDGVQRGEALPPWLSPGAPQLPLRPGTPPRRHGGGQLCLKQHLGAHSSPLWGGPTRAGSWVVAVLVTVRLWCHARSLDRSTANALPVSAERVNPRPYKIADELASSGQRHVMLRRSARHAGVARVRSTYVGPIGRRAERRKSVCQTGRCPEPRHTLAPFGGVQEVGAKPP